MTSKRSIDTLGRAVKRLQDAVHQPETEWTRDAAIQRFEFTWECAWRAIKQVARNEGIECHSPRQALRIAMSQGLIEDNPLWLDMLEDRNRTSHTYDEALAEEIYARLSRYAEAIEGLKTRLDELLARDPSR